MRCSPAWYQSGGVNGVMINKDAWNQLPEVQNHQMAAEICTSGSFTVDGFRFTKKMLEEDGCIVTKTRTTGIPSVRPAVRFTKKKLCEE